MKIQIQSEVVERESVGTVTAIHIWFVIVISHDAKKRGKKKSRRLGVRERDINIKNSQRNDGRVPNKKNSRQNGGRVLKVAPLANTGHGEPDTSSNTGSCGANSDAKNSQRAGRVLVVPSLDETGQGGPDTPQVRPGGGLQVEGVASALHDDVSGA